MFFIFKILFQYLSSSFRFFPYEMLMEIGMDTFDLVALLVGPTLVIGIGMGGADGVGTGGSSVLLHFPDQEAIEEDDQYDQDHGCW